MMIDTKLIGAILGLVVGVIGVTVGPLEALYTFLLGLAGWIIGKYMAGEISIVDIFLERFFSSRLGGPRR